MKQGRSLSEAELTGAKNVAKVLAGVLSIGIASGVALIAGTNKIMSALFPDNQIDDEEDEN